MNTLGTLIDALITKDTKLWYAQEDLYKIRRMSFEEFSEIYSNKTNLKQLYETFKKACDLNVQRNNQIEAIDEYLVNLVEEINSLISGDHKIDTSKLVAKPQKTY